MADIRLNSLPWLWVDHSWVVSAEEGFEGPGTRVSTWVCVKIGVAHKNRRFSGWCPQGAKGANSKYHRSTESHTHKTTLNKKTHEQEEPLHAVVCFLVKRVQTAPQQRQHVKKPDTQRKSYPPTNSHGTVRWALIWTIFLLKGPDPERQVPAVN